MVVSQNREIIEFIKDFRIFDQRKDRKFRFNFQMTDLQAAIGRVQLKKLPRFLERRKQIYERYKEAGFKLLDSKQCNPVRFRAILVTHNQKGILQALEKAKIRAVIPLESWELQGTKDEYPNAYAWTQKTVSLPIYPSLSDDEVEKVINVVQDVL